MSTTVPASREGDRLLAGSQVNHDQPRRLSTETKSAFKTTDSSRSSWSWPAS